MFEGEEIALSAFILKYPSINVHFQFALHRRSLFSENMGLYLVSDSQLRIGSIADSCIHVKNGFDSQLYAILYNSWISSAMTVTMSNEHLWGPGR